MALAYQNPLKTHSGLRGYTRKELEMSITDQEGQNYSLIALFPVVMIGAVIVIICGAYRLRRWKLKKRQLDQLSFFYDLVEGAECDRLGHDRHCAGCDRLRAALVVPPARSSPFFQPPPAKGKKNRLEVPISTASSVDISCQISKLLFHQQDAQVV